MFSLRYAHLPLNGPSTHPEIIQRQNDAFHLWRLSLQAHDDNSVQPSNDLL